MRITTPKLRNPVEGWQTRRHFWLCATTLELYWEIPGGASIWIEVSDMPTRESWPVRIVYGGDVCHIGQEAYELSSTAAEWLRKHWPTLERDFYQTACLHAHVLYRENTP